MLTQLKKLTNRLTEAYALRKFLHSSGLTKSQILETRPTSLVFRLNDDIISLFTADPSTLGHRLEVIILFDADLANLKLLADMADVAHAHRCSISGLSCIKDRKIKLDVAFHFGYTLSHKSVKTGLLYITKCVQEIAELAQTKSHKINRFNLDLTMFEDPALQPFDPRIIGEKKLYQYGDWSNYLLEAYKAHNNTKDKKITEKEIKVLEACKEFEERNKVSLAEIGDQVFAEISKAKLRNKQDKYSIN